jgi:RHS repeat-associated protein
MAGISSKAAGSLINKKGYNGNEIQNKEFSDGSGLELYDFNARTYDQQIGRFIQIDPLTEDGQESINPYHFSFNNPIRFNDPDGEAPDDIVIRGKNNSSITIKTDLIDISVNAGSIVGDLGGNYTLQGNDILVAALDIVGIVDPTGVADVAAATLEAKAGNWGGAILSSFGVVPLLGDLGKIGKVGKHVKTIEKAIDGAKSATTSKAARREAMRDAGIPTSQPLIPDKATKSKDKVFTTRDKNHTVQDAKNDRSHKGKPHWEAGGTKKDPSKPDGLNRSGNNNKPQMAKPKSKVYYNE